MLHPAAVAPSDEQLIRQVRLGDEAAFKAVFLAHYSSMHRSVERIVRSGHVAAELVHDVFLEIWRRRADWEPRDGIGGYLHRAARNRALNHLRRERLDRTIQPNLRDTQAHNESREWGNPEAELSLRELRSAILAAVDQLPPRTREVIMLRWERQLSYAEIGMVMGISPKTVDAQIRRAIAQLRELLRDSI
ncbi:MAG TPA: RNA polymerase sigma-70 factor [Gemmatimonadaceae bacterium]|nr:RNA polymerase sigma-70 factor [Gemmatimonadaceae bacterium]